MPDRFYDAQGQQGGSQVYDLIVYQDALYFNAANGVYLHGLMRYDGSTITELGNYSPAGSYAYGSLWIADNDAFTIYNGSLYLNGFFQGFTNPQTHLIKFDGSTFTGVGSGNALGDLPQSIQSMAWYNDALYFCATDAGSPTHGFELWKYDGTTLGRVIDLNTGTPNSNPSCLTVYNNALYFSADDGSGAKLWKYDGSAVSAVSTVTGGYYGTPSWGQFALYNDAMYFQGGDGRLYMCDGTYTYLITPNNLSHWFWMDLPGQIGGFNGHLYYVGYDGQLWQWQ